MFTEQTLGGQKKQSRPQGSEQEIEAIRKKAIKLKLFIYSKQVHDSIMKMLKAGAKTPIATIGKITAEIITKFEKDGGEIVNDPDVLEGLTKSLIKELITLAVQAEVLTEEQVNEETLFRIVGIAQSSWDKMNPERVDKARANRMMEQGQGDEAVQAAVNQNAQRQGLRNRETQQQAPQPGQQIQV